MVVHWLESTGAWAPWLFLLIFLAASFLMIWRLEALNAGGLEGTVLGTLVMPYCSGIGNLIFAVVMGRKGGPGTEVITNCLVNNVTNLTLLVGLPAVIWSTAAKPRKPGKRHKKEKPNVAQERRLNWLSNLLTLGAVLIFTGTTWALGRDGRIDSSDAFALIGLFLFWQSFHVFEVLKNQVRKKQSFGWLLPVDLALLGLGAYAIYISTDWLVTWISNFHTGFISASYLGWLSGWLMVVPNGLLAFYYARRGNPEIVYSSQVGDGHICIPLCIGLFALYRPLQTTPAFDFGLKLLLGIAVAHIVIIAIWGRIPRFIGWVLTATYGIFLYKGLLK